MLAKGSSWRSFLQLFYYRYRICCSSNVALGYGSAGAIVADKKIGLHGYSMDQRGLKMMMITTNGATRNLDTNMVKVKDDMGKAPVPPVDPPRANYASWAKWMLGSMLSLILPFWKEKWEKLKMIEGEAEIVGEEVESVAAVVQKAATMAENISAEVAEKLPENGKLKETAVLIERVSKATAHDAQLTRDFIHKVDKLKHDFEDLETMVEPVIEKLLQQKSEGK
ncbi:hypothetical protein P3X46_013513 [Hevea brasiliensis]|uniref:Uncharacterized protein n=1 Tax=Hevea brasiliensis TaxID=3981 RepID=A0ABQ9M4W0_HEVBR|nr:uncharacterized protein LOC110637939 isoform X2 [Hevea brasiliensis]KAJ9174918.1 hypothetical protein P3X46_013513 [Hevea brasiliensis]